MAEEKNTMVYVVTNHSEYLDDVPSTDVVGVATTMERAKEMLKEEFDVVMNNTWRGESEDTEIINNEDSISIFNKVINDDYVVIAITPKKLDA